MKGFHGTCWAALLVLGTPLAAWADAGATLQSCAQCHALEAPNDAALSVEERAKRVGPPLYYAGNKFRAQWLEAWLQQPERIRPAGVVPAAHVRTSAEGDAIDPSTLVAHPALDAGEAAAATSELMQLRPYDELLAAQAYQPGKIALRMGQMNFGKFKGCDGCHQDAPGRGGLSGPELYTAWQRLQPAFITSFIADPVSWDAHTIMPRADLKDSEVHKLADYLKALQENQP